MDIYKSEAHKRFLKKVEIESLRYEEGRARHAYLRICDNLMAFKILFKIIGHEYTESLIADAESKAATYPIAEIDDEGESIVLGYLVVENAGYANLDTSVFDFFVTVADQQKRHQGSKTITITQRDVSGILDDDNSIEVSIENYIEHVGAMLHQATEFVIKNKKSMADEPRTNWEIVLRDLEQSIINMQIKIKQVASTGIMPKDQADEDD